MLLKRVIPCLDVKDGRVVKGVRFEGLVDKGDPVAAASAYDRAGADEIVFLDISASHEERRTLLHVVEQVADQVFIPLTVGGGVSAVEHFRDLLHDGADKVVVNTAAVRDPALIGAAAERYGSQCVVVAVDVKAEAGGIYRVYTHGGRTPADREGLSWCEEAARRGAGELLVTSIDRDGTRTGYDVDFLRRLKERVRVPVVASGGAGTLEHFVEAARVADAVLAAGLFHDGVLAIGDVKRALAAAGVAVRAPGDAAAAGAPGPVHPDGATPRFDATGLLPAVIVDAVTGEVLTVAYMNEEAWRRTRETGETWLWSRSRNALWHKGETSGHTQRVVSLTLDCDADAVVVRVHPHGPACHQGTRSCFQGPAGGALVRLDDVLADRAARRPTGSYTAKLLADDNARIKKLGEELAELLRALHVGDDAACAAEAADLVYHVAVALRARGVPLARVLAALAARG
jgi:imidazoleglycerol phosphate synthase cyclase subunit/phosphoribosyl-ATP pyrophosphohydrolase